MKYSIALLLAFLISFCASCQKPAEILVSIPLDSPGSNVNAQWSAKPEDQTLLEPLMGEIINHAGTITLDGNNIKLIIVSRELSNKQTYLVHSYYDAQEQLIARYSILESNSQARSKQWYAMQQDVINQNKLLNTTNE